ncbi:MAG: hypothetical protein ACJAYF_003143 [Arenicella sp.]|jgi:hypothetical protein
MPIVGAYFGVRARIGDSEAGIFVGILSMLLSLVGLMIFRYSRLFEDK